jgi:hypothetical protein
MKMETKTVLIVLGTLILGMIIGALISGAFARHRIRRFMSMGEPGRLEAHVERIIDPDESKREAVREILRKHSERFLEIHSQFEGEMLALRDSLRKDLDPILTDEQKERLERAPKPLKHLRDHRPGQWKDRRPGAPPPGEDHLPGAPPPPIDE